jgi:hypothetical protein
VEVSFWKVFGPVIWVVADDDGIHNIYTHFNAGQLSLTSNTTGACTMKWVHLYTAHFHSEQSWIKPTHIWIYNIPIHSFSGMYKALITLHRRLKFFFVAQQPMQALPTSFWRFLDHITYQFAGRLWTRDQPITENSTWQHRTLTRNRHPCPQKNSEDQFQLVTDIWPLWSVTWMASSIWDTEVHSSLEKVIDSCSTCNLSKRYKHHQQEGWHTSQYRRYT